ncbi:MAG TPA: hypothetical protein VFH25_09180 [Nitrososphaeraceae archaeon]|nr:hypothetical protein [Nitrososphaeraceae archaeon]
MAVALNLREAEVTKYSRDRKCRYLTRVIVSLDTISTAIGLIIIELVIFNITQM